MVTEDGQYAIRHRPACKQHNRCICRTHADCAVVLLPALGCGSEESFQLMQAPTGHSCTCSREADAITLAPMASTCKAGQTRGSLSSTKAQQAHSGSTIGAEAVTPQGSGPYLSCQTEKGSILGAFECHVFHEVRSPCTSTMLSAFANPAADGHRGITGTSLAGK